LANVKVGGKALNSLEEEHKGYPVSTMSKRDYYEVLGVPKQASGEEIKKAFRAKARSLHPDNKTSGDEAAFKELAEAYEVLSSEERRSRYDRFGHEGVKGMGQGFEDVDFSAFAGFGIEDLIDAFLGGSGFRASGRRGGPEQGAHLRFDIQIDFLEAIFGVEKKVSVRRLEDCETCSGSGAAPGSKIQTCSTCGGVGQVQQIVNSFLGQSIRVMQCPNCQGVGNKVEKPCKDCRGEGLTRRSREFELKIPAGIESGSRMRVTGGGDRGKKGGPFGDLYVVIAVKEHEIFIRDGVTIHINQPVSYSMAALGGELLVPTVEGKKLIKVATGTQTGSIVTLRDLGVPRLNNPSRRGDQIVHLIVQTPVKLSSEERKLLEKFAELRGEPLQVDKAEIQAESVREKHSESASEPGDRANHHMNAQADDEEGQHSFFEKIGDFFKPKNGEHDASK
jgi:molecular chaperone DnaJ